MGKPRALLGGSAFGYFRGSRFTNTPSALEGSQGVSP